MKEQDYQRKIINFLRSKGAYVVKVIAASKAGVPDIIFCYGGLFGAIEVKTPEAYKKKDHDASQLQIANLNWIKNAQGFSMVACSTEQVGHMLDEMVKDWRYQTPPIF